MSPLAEGSPAQQIPAVRMGMSRDDVEFIQESALRLPEDVRRRVVKQLWLRSVLLEMRALRYADVEGGAFDHNADAALAAMDPEEASL